jgi:SAM-dependent methyltransferase
MLEAERLARVRRVYRVFASFYDAFRRLWSRWTRGVELELDRLFAERITPESRLLELGPGTGVNLERLRRCAPSFRSYLGVDASEAMLRQAREKVVGDRRVDLRLGDVTDLRDLPDPFDFVVSTWVLSHLEDPTAVVRDALARLAPGGTAVFVFSSPPRSPWLRLALAPIYRLAAARFVDPEPIGRLPQLEVLRAFAAGLATLAVFRAPDRPGR